MARASLTGDELRRQAASIQDLIEFRAYRQYQRAYIEGGSGFGTLRDLTLALVSQVKAREWDPLALVLAIELEDIETGNAHTHEESELVRHLACIGDLMRAYDTTG